MPTASKTFHAKKRKANGTRACRRLRAEGEVPAVLYGHKEKTEAVQVSYEELEGALRHHGRMFELNIGHKKEPVLLKEVQYDALGTQIVHADFQRVAMDEKLTLEVPITLKGKPKVEHAVLQQTLGAVEVECLPGDIPEEIIAQTADMEMGDTVHVSDLDALEGVKVLTDPETIVAARQRRQPRPPWKRKRHRPPRPRSPNSSGERRRRRPRNPKRNGALRRRLRPASGVSRPLNRGQTCSDETDRGIG